MDVMDISAMKVADLKKELKSRGLSTSGNKSELIDRLQLALAKPDDLNEEELLAEEPEAVALVPPKKVPIKRDVAMPVAEATVAATAADSHVGKENIDDAVPPPAKKATPVAEKTAAAAAVDSKSDESPAAAGAGETTKDAERAAARAARFGIAPAESPDEKKVDRAKRFGIPVTASPGSNKIGSAPAADMETLKKRAERFGLNASQTMQKAELDEKIKKRQDRFGAVGKNEDGLPKVKVNEDESLKKRAERFGV